jgi:hypothetical protein
VLSVRNIRLALLVVLATSLGCDSGDEPPIDPPPPAGQLVIGSSELSGVGFVSVEDGADVELVSGAQGGFHMWTSLRAMGVAGEVYLQREARRVDDGTLILRAQRLYLEIPDDAMEDWWERSDAAPSFMCPSPIGVQVYDVEIALTATLTDDDGEILAEDHKVMVPRCPTGEQREFCENICGG